MVNSTTDLLRLAFVCLVIATTSSCSSHGSNPNASSSSEPESANLSPPGAAKPIADVQSVVIVEVTVSDAYGPEMDVNNRPTRNFRTAVVAGNYDLPRLFTEEELVETLEFGQQVCHADYEVDGLPHRSESKIWSPVLDLASIPGITFNAASSSLTVLNEEQVFSELARVESSTAISYPHYRVPDSFVQSPEFEGPDELRLNIAPWLGTLSESHEISVFIPNRPESDRKGATLFPPGGPFTSHGASSEYYWHQWEGDDHDGLTMFVQLSSEPTEGRITADGYVEGKPGAVVRCVAPETGEFAFPEYIQTGGYGSFKSRFMSRRYNWSEKVGDTLILVVSESVELIHGKDGVQISNLTH